MFGYNKGSSHSGSPCVWMALVVSSPWPPRRDELDTVLDNMARILYLAGLNAVEINAFLEAIKENWDDIYARLAGMYRRWPNRANAIESLIHRLRGYNIMVPADSLICHVVLNELTRNILD